MDVDLIWKSFKLLAVINTLVLSPNNRRTKIDPWGTPHAIVPQFDEDVAAYFEVLFQPFCCLF
jgi:hypothetical protein